MEIKVNFSFTPEAEDLVAGLIEALRESSGALSGITVEDTTVEEDVETEEAAELAAIAAEESANAAKKVEKAAKAKEKREAKKAAADAKAEENEEPMIDLPALRALATEAISKHDRATLVKTLAQVGATSLVSVALEQYDTLAGMLKDLIEVAPAPPADEDNLLG